MLKVMEIIAKERRMRERPKERCWGVIECGMRTAGVCVHDVEDSFKRKFKIRMTYLSSS